MNRIFGLFFLFLLSSLGSTFSQSNMPVNSSDIKLALDKMNVLGTVLYVAAHPDDENNALLAYLAKGRLLRTGYLSMTRGDGGQNLIGTEQGDLLGVLRTQELLAARRIDGAKQFFTRAVDFGYSKSADETMKFWGREKILSDIVWVIRKFRPDVIITRFPGTGEGVHGHHTASEILAAEAFKISGDSSEFPAQLKYVKPWKAERIIWNAWPPLIKKRGLDPSTLLKVDDGAYNPLLGESYTEIGAKARSMHKSQGFGSSPRLGQNYDYFLPIAGSPAKHSLFDGIDITWNRVPGGKRIENILLQADKKFDPEHPGRIIPVLLKAYSEMNKLKDNFWIRIKKKDLTELIKDCAGIEIRADAPDYSAVPGERLAVECSIINRSDYPFVLKKIKTDYAIDNKILNYRLPDNKLFTGSSEIILPADMPYSQPYWLEHSHGLGDYNVSSQLLIGQAQNKAPVNADFVLEAEGEELNLSVPVKHAWTDPVKGEQERNLIIVPAVAVNITHKNYLFPGSGPRRIDINLIANKDSLSGTLKFKHTGDWKIEPGEKSFSMVKKGDMITESFTVIPPANATVDTLEVLAQVNNKIINRGMVSVNYSHIPVQTVFPLSDTKLIKLDIKKVIDNIGYIMGPGDEVPVYLKELGYNVTMLNNRDIEEGDLSKYDAVITGIRLYNTDGQLAFDQSKLLEYVKNGGTLVVQYNKNFGLVTKDIGPYPFHISNKRVTDELAHVTFLHPNNVLLNFPNKITEKDFNGWVQERGVYFADEWDPRYETVIACHDAGELPLKGGLLYTKYGKGVFIYTGYDWFRELPDGVPGAYRIFVNLISSGKAGK